MPQVAWKAAVMGPVYPKVLTGFICCDAVQYERFTKEHNKATAVYVLRLICPNPKDMELATEPIEDMAMQVKEILRDNPTIDGWARDSFVNLIQFGTPTGMPTIGEAILQLVVDFIDE